MIFNWNPIIAKALMDDTTIAAYVGKTAGGNPVVGNLKLPAGIFPAIEYHEISGSDSHFSDDGLYARRYYYQVSIFTQDNSRYQIENTIDTIMRSLGFTCYYEDEAYEEDVKVYSRVLLYKQTLSEEKAAALVASL